ncbi:unnamed protein product [Caenorhabditis bovis]|uniref:Uncharacterized protein n=1 Tax=Caenorhabditis bovis TaxID=2654633 RepID=A0A8S1EL52_9PELO|nr:unnamed protein product [Caenorhabditis bovis]
MSLYMYSPNLPFIYENPKSYCEMCKICNKPFNFTNLDFHFENGCAAKIMEMEKEKERLAALSGEKSKQGFPVNHSGAKPFYITVPIRADEPEPANRKRASAAQDRIVISRESRKLLKSKILSAEQPKSCTSKKATATKRNNNKTNTNVVCE